MAMNLRRGTQPHEPSTVAYAHLFQALSETARLAVLQHLTSGEHRVKDLVEHMGLAQSTVSKHLQFLLGCGLVKVRTEGRSSLYSLADPQSLAEVLDSARLLVMRTMDAEPDSHGHADELGQSDEPRSASEVHSAREQGRLETDAESNDGGATEGGASEVGAMQR